MAKQYLKLDRPVKSYGDDQLKQVFADMPKSEILRTIILNEREHLAVSYDRSLRSFWYATVKPVLSRIGRLEKKHKDDRVVELWSADLSRYFADLVKNGELLYSDLRIVDDSRSRENPANRYQVDGLASYGYIRSIAPHSNIVITTEKDTIYSIISGVARLFGCSCISGHGQNSLAAMEDLIRGMEEPQDVYILTMTDYDPAGYEISKTFQKQVTYLRRNLCRGANIHLERIGLTPDQLTEEEVNMNVYEPKRSGLARWFRETGGVNGAPYGLELDALTPDRIRQIFASSLKTYITDQSPYKSFIREEYVKSVILEGIRPFIETMTAEILATAEAQNITVYDFDMFDLCERGFNYIPVKQLCRDNRDAAIIGRAKTYFNNH